MRFIYIFILKNKNLIFIEFSFYLIQILLFYFYPQLKYYYYLSKKNIITKNEDNNLCLPRDTAFSAESFFCVELLTQLVY